MSKDRDTDRDDIGASLRAERAREQKLERLAEADLPAAERESLERELGVTSRDPREALAALSGESRARMGEGVLASLSAGTPHRSEVGPVSPSDRPSSRPRELLSSESPGGEREPVPSVAAQRRRKANIGIGLLIAAAAGLALWLRASEPDPQLEWARYSLEVQGDGFVERAAPKLEASTTPLRLHSGSVLTLIARPEQEIEGAVEASVQLIPNRGAERRLEPRVERASSGALRLRVELPEDLPAGGTLVLTIWRPSALPAKNPPPPATNAQGPGWQRLVRAFELVER